MKAEHLNHPDYTCDVPNCSKMFRLKKDGVKHKKEHNQGYPPPTCDFCGELIQNRMKLRKHLRATHAVKSKYMCAICTVSHKTYDELQVHLKENHPSFIGKLNTCTICARKCPSKYKLDTHMKKFHGDEFFICFTCYDVFRKEEEYIKHCEIHPTKKQKSASKAQDEIKNSDAESENEKESVKRKLPPNDKENVKVAKFSHKCVCCRSSFVTTSELYRHQLEDHKSLKCIGCNTYYESEDALENHKSNCKPGEGKRKRKPVSASVLGRNLVEQVTHCNSDDELNAKNRSSLNSLDENSSGSKELWGSTPKGGGTSRKVYDNDYTHSPCEHCNKIWPAKRTLWQHLIRSHKTEAATTCGVCLKSCISYDDLDIHLAEVHPRNFEEEDSNATCRVCGRYHNARSKLQLHAAIHVGEEERALTLQYDCSHCEMNFKSRGFLIKHQSESHNISSLNNYPPIGGSITSDDDDSRFEGFPDDNSEVPQNLFGLINFKTEGSVSKVSLSPTPESVDEDVSDRNSDVDDIEIEASRSSDVVDIEMEASRSSDVDIEMEQSRSSAEDGEDLEVEPSATSNCSIQSDSSSDFDKSEKSVCRDSFEGVVKLLKRNENQRSTSDLEKEDEDDDSVHSELNDDESEVVGHSVLQTYQTVSGLSHCSRQSMSYEDNSLELPYASETNRYINQNITDTEIENLVT